MSVKKGATLFFFILILGAATYQAFLPFTKTTTASVASVAKPIHISQYSGRGVVDRVIHLDFKTKDSKEVIAIVSMPFDFDGEIQYQWTLGENIDVIEGTLKGSLPTGLRKDHAQQIKLVVQGFDQNQLRHIGFEIWGDKNGRRIYADGLISSQQENSFENIVQNVEKIKAEKRGIQK